MFDRIISGMPFFERPFLPLKVQCLVGRVVTERLNLNGSSRVEAVRSELILAVAEIPTAPRRRSYVHCVVDAMIEIEIERQEMKVRMMLAEMAAIAAGDGQ